MEGTKRSNQKKNENCRSKRSKRMHLLCETQIDSDITNGAEYNLSLPESRIDRRNSGSCLKIQSSFSDSWKSHVQSVYNMCPVGPYAGPYDQAACVPLSVQLIGSDLNFERYTQFQHDAHLDCMKYRVSCIYDTYDDLEKINVLGPVEIVSTHDGPVDINNDYKKKIYYTCRKKRCEIPCPCKDCCTQDGQCTEHKMGHPNLFDSKLHAVSIRGSDLSCQNSSFFQRSYVNKYSQIPVSCKSCRRDVLHHNAYHIDYHFYCRFCVQNHHKTKPSTEGELLHEIKEETKYYHTVCYHCNKKFQDKDACKQHIEYSHNEAPYKCDQCEAKYTSKSAKEYHIKSIHDKETLIFECEICDAKFEAEMILQDHKKYVHTTERNFKCEDCPARFKRNKDLQHHMKNIHNYDQKIETYGEGSEIQEFKCDECNLIYSYKKSLNDHIKRKHSGIDEEFKCEECGKIFNQKKSLNRHVKTHE
jgi:uncharacterized C2H2 Zn-finger protein